MNKNEQDYRPPNPEGLKPTEKIIKDPSLAKLQDNFAMRFDADGIRDVMVIGNERPKGCPFKCQGCGVHEEALIVDDKANQQVIINQVNNIEQRLVSRANEYNEVGYHICIYNYGNVTNHEELSIENLELLLNKINDLMPSPKYVSLNSRGHFINEKTLSHLIGLGLKYNIHFILGVETLTEKGGKIYGKPNMDAEVASLFGVINEFNEKNKTNFGVDAGFVFLPEYYSDDRTDKDKVAQGFLDDVGGFIEKYVGQKTPVLINIHPFYEISGIPYKSTAESFNTLMESLIKLEAIIKTKNLSLTEDLRASFFIGLNDSGYETPEWKQAKLKWQADIDRINRSE